MKHGMNPGKWKMYMEKLKKAEDEIWADLLSDTEAKVVKSTTNG
ncbi:MAG: hypothetical protein QW292_09065 [Candidatus Parvarchaeota archaeon]